MAPTVGHLGVDALVGVEFDVPQHVAFGVDAVGHALFFVLVGVEHGAVHRDAEEVTQRLHAGVRRGGQILELDVVLALRRHGGQEIDDVLMALPPQQLRHAGGTPGGIGQRRQGCRVRVA